MKITTFNELFKIDNCDNVEEIDLFGEHNINDKFIIKIIAQCYNLKILKINAGNEDHINEIANLQKIIDFAVLTNDNINLFISNNKKNIIVTENIYADIDQLLHQIKNSLCENITLFTKCKSSEKIINVLPITVLNIRIVTSSIYYSENALGPSYAYIKFNPRNIPVILKSLHIIFRETKFTDLINKDKETNLINVVKNNVKIPFGCNFNIDFLQ